MTEMALFAATGQEECFKKECQNRECWGNKNHKGFPPIKKHKSLGGAATSEVIPQSYGRAQHFEGRKENEDGYTQVSGVFVATKAPDYLRCATPVETSNMFSPPSTFAEELSEDED